jgi:heme oxygenase
MSAAASSTESSIRVDRSEIRESPGGGLRQRLRAATADAHGRLDAQLARLDLRALSGYRHFLEVSAAALLALEAALVRADVGRLFPDWRLRSRSRVIVNDLGCVGGSVRPFAVPDRFGFDDVLGTMYVLEGSRLGARALAGVVAKSADPVVVAATAYLRHGAGLQLWPSFLVMLERHAVDLGDDTGAVAAARRAFDLFYRAASDRAPLDPRWDIAGSTTAALTGSARA